MPKTEQEKKAAAKADQDQGKLLTTAIAASVDSAVQSGFKSLIPTLAEQIGASVKTAMVEAIRPLSESFDDLKVVQIAAAGADLEARKAADDESDDGEDTQDDDDDDDDDDEDDMKAKKDDDDEEMDAGKADDEEAAKSDDDEDDLEAELEHLTDDAADEEPGEVNKDAKLKGDKTTVTKGKTKSKSQPIAASSVKASATMINKLYASTRQLLDDRKKLQKTIRNQNNKIAAMEAQLERAAEATDRRTVVPAELSTILAKSNVDIRELQASGQKLSVADVDQMLSSEKLGHTLDVTTRMHIKNMFLERGLMEQGEVRRFQ